MIRLIAFDPSLTATGIAVLELAEVDRVLHVECVRTKPDKSSRHLYKADEDGERIDSIANRVLALITQYEPRIAACEAPAGSQHANAAKALALAYATVRTALRAHGVMPMMVQAFEAKIAASGSKKASKEQVREAMRARWGVPEIALGSRLADPVQEAIADALAVASCALESRDVRTIRAVFSSKQTSLPLFETP